MFGCTVTSLSVLSLLFWNVLFLLPSARAGVSSAGIIARICPCWSNSGLRPCVWCSVLQSPHSRTRCSLRRPPHPLWRQKKTLFTRQTNYVTVYMSFCRIFWDHADVKCSIRHFLTFEHLCLVCQDICISYLGYCNIVFFLFLKTITPDFPWGIIWYSI